MPRDPFLDDAFGTKPPRGCGTRAAWVLAIEAAVVAVVLVAVALGPEWGVAIACVLSCAVVLDLDASRRRRSLERLVLGTARRARRWLHTTHPARPRAVVGDGGARVVPALAERVPRDQVVVVAQPSRADSLFNLADAHCEGCGGCGRRWGFDLDAGQLVLIPCPCTNRPRPVVIDVAGS